MQRKRGQQLVQSLERGLAALEMALDGSVRPSHVAAALGIDRSTAYRLLYTLMAKGYLLQDERTREFTSNPTKFFQLYGKVATLLDWPDVAGDFLTKLREQSGETANLGVRQANNVIYIAHKPGQAALSVNFALGTSRPLHCSALGKALLAAQPDAVTAEWVASAPLTTYTSQDDYRAMRSSSAIWEPCAPTAMLSTMRRPLPACAASRRQSMIIANR